MLLDIVVVSDKKNLKKGGSFSFLFETISVDMGVTRELPLI